MITWVSMASAQPHSTDWVGVVQDAVLTLTFLALIWYACETRRLRQATADQVRLLGFHLMEIGYYQVIQRDADSIVLTNKGPAVAIATLQGFRVAHGTEVIRCTFEETRMILSGTWSVLPCTMRLEPLSTTSTKTPGIPLLTALKRTVDVDKLTRILRLYARDLLGHAYVCDVEINFVDLNAFPSIGQEALPFRVSAPRQIPKFPDTVDPLDCT
jgi:hypothetical protein